MDESAFTATEKKILRVLGDGADHPLADFQTALDDELLSRETLIVHIVRIRPKIPRHLQIDCTRKGYQSRWKMSRRLVADHIA